ncbi:MAG: carbohydrate ABC transporter permease [Eubacteriales bacterium]|nr:carbohydrate ABC transporter permease [Eubacteriales bacterium]
MLKDRLRKRFRAFIKYLILALMTVFFLLPFVWILSTSLKEQNRVFVYPPEWIPRPVQWENYKLAITEIPFLHYIWNTIKIAFLAMLGNVLVSPMVAYAFGKLRWRGRDKVFILVLATMMLPFTLTMIPLYATWSKLGLVNTVIPLVAQDFLGKGYFVFLLRQFFMRVPDELMEAGRIDGASEGQIFWRIAYPLIRPALVTVGIFAFVWSWTDFMGPLIYLKKPELWTISIGLSQFTTSVGMNWPAMMAAAAISIIPMVVVFAFLQRYFMEGSTASGIKG